MLKLAAHDKSAPAIYRTLAAGAVGYLEYRRCVSGDALERNLHDALTRAQQAKVRALVVDVRRNGGGSNSANDQVTISPPSHARKATALPFARAAW